MPPSNVQGAGSLYGRLVATRPQGAAKFKSMRSDLNLFAAEDLYEYACPEGVQNPRLASGEELIERTEQCVRDWMRNTSERSAAERLRSRAREVFGDDAERRRYDEYLQWHDLKAVFAGLEERLDPAIGSCTTSDVSGELARLRELLGSRSQAEALMESYLANRGIELIDAHDLQVSTAAGRAQVREELAASNCLPDSAFQPSTPPPSAQQISGGAVAGSQAVQVGASYQQQPPVAQVGQAAGSQVGVIRRCSCGCLNSADQTFCVSCGRPIEGTSAIPPIARGGVRAAAAPIQPPAPRKRKFPVAAVAVSLVFIAVIVGALAFLAINELPPFGNSSSSAASEHVERVQSGQVKSVPCAAKTRIVILDADEERIDAYRVKFERIEGSGPTPDSSLRVRGRDGFMIKEYNEKALESIGEGTYRVIVLEDDGEDVAESSDEEDVICTFTIDYKESNTKAEKTIEAVAK